MILAIVLPGVAGAVNASGFLAVGTYTSHVTGHVARIGDEVAQGRTAGALQAFFVVLVFLSGAMTATALIERARRLARARYVAPLLLQAFVLAGFGVWAGFRSAPGDLALTSLLCFAMGLQNALVTKVSGAVIRTTHLTGIVTDIGIELVRLAEWLKDELSSRPSVSRSLRVGKLLFAGPDWKKLRLHIVILGSFGSGAFIGPQVFLEFGQRAMVVPCFTLLLLAAFDFVLGIRGQAHGPSVSTPPRQPEGASTLSVAERITMVRQRNLAEHLAAGLERAERELRSIGAVGTFRRCARSKTRDES